MASVAEDSRATIELLAHVRETLETARRLVSRALLAAADPILLEEGLRTFAEDGNRLRREDAA